MTQFSYCYAECRHAECHYAECRYAECHYVESPMVSVIMLYVVMLNVVTPAENILSPVWIKVMQYLSQPRTLYEYTTISMNGLLFKLDRFEPERCFTQVGSSLTANIRLGCKSFPGTNALAYYEV